MVLVVCVVELVGGGAGAGAPIVSICPAITETASVRLRTVTALSWRKVFTFSCLLETRKNFAVLSETSLIGLAKPCKGRTCYVKFALAFSSLSLQSGKKQIVYVLTGLTTAHTRKLKS